MMNINYRRFPFVGIMLFFSSGIICYEYFKISVGIPLVVMGFCIFLAVILKRFSGIATVLILAAFLFLGILHSSSYQLLSKNDIDRFSRSFYGRSVLLEGVVVSDAETRRVLRLTKTVFKLKVKRLNIDGRWREVSGDVLVNLFRGENIDYGDHLSMEGRLHKPFNFSSDSNFSYEDYLNRRGIDLIFSVKKGTAVNVLEHDQGNFLMAFIMRIKGRFNRTIEAHFSQIEIGLMQGFLVGDRYNIPEYINQLFQKGGVVHILAISGFNVGIVAYVIFLILNIFPVNRQVRYVTVIIILIFYALMSGSQPPVVRATIMAAVFLLSFMFEREPQPLNTLACAAFLILLINPLNIFDVGFQLSFLSVWAIIALYPRLTSVLSRIKGLENILKDSSHQTQWIYEVFPWGAKYFVQSALVSLAAYAGVLMPVVYYFEIVTPVSILANLFVIPLAAIIVVLGIAFLLAGLIFTPAAFLFANCIKLTLALMVWIVHLCVQIPGAYFSWNGLSLYAVFIYYVLLLLLLIRFPAPVKRR